MLPAQQRLGAHMGERAPNFSDDSFLDTIPHDYVASRTTSQMVELG